MLKQSTGETIRRARVSLGITQQQLADKVNDLLPASEFVERTMISRWEKDQNFPRNSRKSALEGLLGVDLGSPPHRRETQSAYITNQPQLQASLLAGLENCTELVMTNASRSSNIWEDMPESRQALDKLRQSRQCLFKEIFYVKDLADLEKIEALAKENYPHYRVRVRLSPAHPLPLLLAPNKRYGLFMSGFGDDVPSVGLELKGDLSGFVDYYFRYIWDDGLTILDESGLVGASIEQMRASLISLGGTTPNSFGPN